MQKRAITLLSAGLDSSIATLMLIQSGWEIVEAITFDYGQKASKKEIAQSIKISSHLKIPHTVKQITWFKEYGSGGALIDRTASLPRPDSTQIDAPIASKETARAVWVPNRNGIFIELCAGIAEDKGLNGIVVGFNKEEAASFNDNSHDYLTAINQALYYSTSNAIQVISPTIDLDKTQIVRIGKRANFPFELLWSCYDGANKMCGKCESCLRLKRALSSSEVSIDSLFQDGKLY